MARQKRFKETGAGVFTSIMNAANKKDAIDSFKGEYYKTRGTEYRIRILDIEVILPATISRAGQYKITAERAR